MGKGREIKALFFYLFLVLASFLPYLSLLNADFVQWDDDVYVVENARVQKGITFENIKWAFTTTYFGFYYPLTWLSHMLDCELFGLNSKMHYLTSIIWYVLNKMAFNYALANDATGEEKIAKNLYSRVLQLDKKHIASRKKLIEILIKESNFDEALKVVEEGFSIYPHDKELNSFKDIVLKDEKNRKTD